MIYFSKLSFLNQSARSPCLFCEQRADLNRKFHITFFCTIIHQLTVKIRCRHWFLTIAMLSRFHDSHADRGVQVIMYADVYRIDIIPFQHFSKVCIYILHPVPQRPVIQSLLIDFCRRNHLHLRNVFPHLHMPV